MRRTAIEGLLPAAYQRAARDGSPLAALLEVMETLHAPDEEILADVHSRFAPYTADPEFLPFLTTWVSLDYLVGPVRPGGRPRLLVPEARARDLLAEAASIAQLRGTRLGLVRVLELATGVRGFAVADAVDRPFHVVVTAPAAAADQSGLVSHIVGHEKPAAATFEIEWEGES